MDLPQNSIWKQIKNYEGLYLISNFGEVIAEEKLKGFYKSPKKIKKPNIKKGYLTVNLWKDNKVKTFLIHRLVAINFLDIDKNRKYVNHKDGNKLNNNCSNLEWVTSSENTIHAINNGLYTTYNEKHPKAKLNKKQILEIRNNDLKLKELANIYNVSFQNISRIKNYETWKNI